MKNNKLFIICYCFAYFGLLDLILSTWTPGIKTGLIILSSCDSGANLPVYDLNDKINPNELNNVQSPYKSQDTYIFGFDLRASPQEDARQYLPFLAYLEKTTGYKFKLQFTPIKLDIAE